jgi:hypothetical protein
MNQVKEASMGIQDPLVRLRQRAYRHALEDGTADIVAGFYTLIIGVATQKRVFLALAVVYLMVFATAWKFLSHQVSSRRIGYAEVPEDPPKQLLLGSMAAGVLTLLVVAVITLSAGRLWNLAHWPTWTPVLAGLILAGGWLHTALRSGLRRYFAYAAVAAGGSLFFWLFPFGPRINPSDRLTLFFFALAAVIVAAGFAVLARFKRSRPIVSMDGCNE